MKQDYFDRAKAVIPGGVNSPVRAFGSVGSEPVFMARGEGSRVFSEDGREFIDYVGSWGPMILGHADSDVIAAVQHTVSSGLSFGAPTVLETQLAEEVCRLMPSIERVRMVNSGTEATMSAIRLARGFTNRPLIIKFEGCYHGHADSLLVKAGSGALTLGIPGSAGVPEAIAGCTLTCAFNDEAKVSELFQKYGDQIAGIIVEPIAGNMNMILPRPGYLELLRSLCDQHGSVLIFDEVMTGFRVALGGAQQLYGITPDITTLGKIIGGGMPVGAFGGRKEIMEHIAPQGPVYQAGTLSGNPVGMAAGIATLKKIQAPDFYPTLEQKNLRLMDLLQQAAASHDIDLQHHARGGMFGLFFTDQSDIYTFDDVSRCDVERFVRFFNGMLKRGFYFAPSAYEAGFISITHTEADIEATAGAAGEVFSELRN